MPVAVAEVTGQRPQHSRLGRATGTAVTHVNRDTGIEHQLGDSIARLLVAVRVIVVQHLVPLIDRLTKNDAQESGVGIVHIAVIGVTASTTHRPLMVIHDLGHRSSHTPGHSLSSIATVGGAQQVIGPALVPECRHQGRNGSAGNRFVDLCTAVGLQVSDFAVHLGHPVLHSQRQIVGIKSSRGAVAQHLRQAVITGNNDKARFLATVKNIKTVSVGCIGKPQRRLACRRREP